MGCALESVDASDQIYRDIYATSFDAYRMGG